MSEGGEFADWVCTVEMVSKWRMDPELVALPTKTKPSMSFFC